MGILKKSFLELIGVIAVLAVIFFIVSLFIDDERGYRVVDVKINEQELVLEIADNSFLHEVGLSGRESLGKNEGMLFVYDYEVEGLTFWMKDTLIPLDIIFLNEALEIVYIIENMEVCTEDPCPKYISQEKSKYAIEVNAGWVSENDVKVGDIVEIIDRDQSDA